MSNLYRLVPESEASGDLRIPASDGVTEEGLVAVPVEPVGALTVSDDGYRWDTKPIREGRMGIRGLPLDPGKYLIVALEADDE